MSHKLLHVFEHADGQGLLNGGKVVEEFREGSAMFEIVEQRPNWYPRAHEHGRPDENVGIRMYARDLVVHGLTFSDSALPSIRPSFPDRPFGVPNLKWVDSANRSQAESVRLGSGLWTTTTRGQYCHLFDREASRCWSACSGEFEAPESGN